MKTAIRRLSLMLAFACLFAALTLSQDKGSAVAGTWNMTSQTANGDLQWVLNIKQQGDTLAGTIKTPEGGEEALKEFSFKDGTLTFKAPYQGEYYDIAVKLADGKLEGTWSGQGDSGRTYGTKAS